MNTLQLDEFSYWERKTYFEGIDFLVIGSGIVGINAAIQLKTTHPKAKVVVAERGMLPSGASTKNAGFACFGSPTELLDDLKQIPESVVWETVEKRWRGLQALQKMIGNDVPIDQCGSWDLIEQSDKTTAEEVRDQLSYFNSRLSDITNCSNVFKEDQTAHDTFGFKGISTSFFNQLEGQIHTGQLMDMLHRKAISLGIYFLFGIEIRGIQLHLYNVGIQSNLGYFKVRNVAVCTNGFARQLLPGLNVQPARAQVMVTTPIPDLTIKGTFHFDRGYYYFRNIDDCLLIGGGRNLDPAGETSMELHTTMAIQESIENLLRTVILPSTSFDIAYRWAGIMGIGSTKQPIVEAIDDKIAVGVRMGGMGVAIGTLIGQEVAKLFD